MEGCKKRARQAGLCFEDETLEYIVTNKDLLELSPKMMIPTLYDYWVQEVEVLKEKGRYELYPFNPFETVINTRPPISFYNDNNPDWLNVMIFYHVLAHIDFFQNNLYYQHTWDYDFNGEALADKRLIARLRSEKGRWVDYIIEFARGIDNLVGYHKELSNLDKTWKNRLQKQVDFYFDVFLQEEKKFTTQEYLKQIEEYNSFSQDDGEQGVQLFFTEVRKRYPEFDEKFKKHEKEKTEQKDFMQFLAEKSPFIQKNDNQWMKSVIEVVRRTSIFFQPQIRTKIMNEGWATYWHERLFLSDDRINGHEIDFSKTHSKVASLSRVGLNPYALGLRLFYEIEERADKGMFSLDFDRVDDIEKRKRYNNNSNKGQEFISYVRKIYSDYMFIHEFVDQDFVDKYRLFVTGKKLNKSKRKWEYYVKSRKAEEYRKMLLDSMYHPPHITFFVKENGGLYLTHHFEGKPLVKEFIANTMLGIEYLWGGPVYLETNEVSSDRQVDKNNQIGIVWQKVLYTMENRTLSKKTLS